MKRASLFLALALLLGVSATTLQSQDAEPAPAPALAPPAPIAPVQRAATLEMLKAMRDARRGKTTKHKTIAFEMPRPSIAGRLG